MIKRTLHVAAVGFAVLALQGEKPAEAAESRSHTIVMQHMKFVAVPATLRNGDTILWVNRDVVPHTATAGNRGFDVVLRPQQSARTIVKQTGKIAFYCRYHPAMRGTLVVAN